MSSVNTTDLLNPFTPLAWLPPEIAYQVQIGNYVVTGTLAAFIWDLFCNALNDYKLVSQYRVGPGTVVYFIARVSTLFYLLSATLYLTYPLNNCVLARKFYEVGCAISVPANSLLIFLRARAIFNDNRALVLCFFALWLTVAGTAIMPAIPGMIKAANIGPTKYCTTAGDKSYTGVFTIAPPIHDTVIFVAISWRMFHNSHLIGGSRTDRGLGGVIKAAMTGEYLPQFSRAVLMDGQLYYLITVIANLPSAIMSFNDRVTATYRTMFFVCTVMVTNCMACHVLRNTKFGYHRRVVTTTELHSRTTRSTAMVRMPIPRSGGPQSDTMPTVVTDIVVTGDNMENLSKEDLEGKVHQI
ncbi:hypothetical protein K438DRAFT_1676795 [Mycena galopus ATCC 62051]|nr:hypothetical protein K438DRAFT_1676795 [Mycena galopus ATCC 62051]